MEPSAKGHLPHEVTELPRRDVISVQPGQEGRLLLQLVALPHTSHFLVDDLRWRLELEESGEHQHQPPVQGRMVDLAEVRQMQGGVVSDGVQWDVHPVVAYGAIALVERLKVAGASEVEASGRRRQG